MIADDFFSLIWRYAADAATRHMPLLLILRLFSLLTLRAIFRFLLTPLLRAALMLPCLP